MAKMELKQEGVALSLHGRPPFPQHSFKGSSSANGNGDDTRRRRHRHHSIGEATTVNKDITKRPCLKFLL